jgi:hypothetical protein
LSNFTGYKALRSVEELEEILMSVNRIQRIQNLSSGDDDGQLSAPVNLSQPMPDDGNRNDLFTKYDELVNPR